MAGLVPFEPSDLLGLQLQSAQVEFGSSISPEYAQAMASGGPSWSLLGPSGVVLACGGLFMQWEGRASAWAFLSPATPMRLATRCAREMLDSCGIRRVECWVDVDFQAGHRWARLLGFNLEGRMAGFSPEGRDMDLYSRVVR